MKPAIPLLLVALLVALLPACADEPAAPTPFELAYACEQEDAGPEFGGLLFLARIARDGAFSWDFDGGVVEHIEGSWIGQDFDFEERWVPGHYVVSRRGEGSADYDAGGEGSGQVRWDYERVDGSVVSWDTDFVREGCSLWLDSSNGVVTTHTVQTRVAPDRRTFTVQEEGTALSVVRSGNDYQDWTSNMDTEVDDPATAMEPDVTEHREVAADGTASATFEDRRDDGSWYEGQTDYQLDGDEVRLWRGYDPDGGLRSEGSSITHFDRSGEEDYILHLAWGDLECSRAWSASGAVLFDSCYQGRDEGAGPRRSLLLAL